MSDKRPDFSDFKWIPREIRLCFYENKKVKRIVARVKDRGEWVRLTAYFQASPSWYSATNLYFNYVDVQVGREDLIFNQPVCQVLATPRNTLKLSGLKTSWFYCVDGEWHSADVGDFSKTDLLVSEGDIVYKVVIKIFSPDGVLKHTVDISNPRLTT